LELELRIFNADVFGIRIGNTLQYREAFPLKPHPSPNSDPFPSVFVGIVSSVSHCHATPPPSPTFATSGARRTLSSSTGEQHHPHTRPFPPVKRARPCPPPPASHGGPVLPPRQAASSPSLSATELHRTCPSFAGKPRRPLPPPLSRAIPVILSSARCAAAQLPHLVLLLYPSDEA
jgi:hypothetical protein